VVHGHTPVEEPEIHHNRISIHTGAYISDRLEGTVGISFKKHPGRSLATSGRAGCAGRSKLNSSGIGKVSGFSGFSGISHFRIEPCTLRPKMIQIHASQL
jgi:hypothetical protein